MDHQIQSSELSRFNLESALSHSLTPYQIQRNLKRAEYIIQTRRRLRKELDNVKTKPKC